MAIDSAVKRLSVLQLKLPFRLTLPFPSGAVTSADRYTLALSYAGTSFNPPPATQPAFQRVHRFKHSQWKHPQ